MAPYRLPGVKTLLRYHVLGASTWVDTLPDAAQDTLTFQPGEFVAWLATAPAGGDVPPAVRLVLPYEPTITGPITLHADAHAAHGLKQVEFFVNGKSIGTATKAPYTITWDAVTPLKGEWHGIKAVATDLAGHTSEARAMVRVAGQ